MSAEFAANLVEEAVLLINVFRTIRLIGSGKRSMACVFYLFALISLAISNAYWLIYEILRPETRMPMAANEFGETAFFLLLASMLGNIFPRDGRLLLRERVGTTLFGAASIGLWIVWSGEWFQDIFFGFFFCFFLMMVVRTARQSGACSRKEWYAVEICASVLIACEIAVQLLKDPVRTGLDVFCYILMFGFLGYLLKKLFASLRRKEDAKISLVLGVAGIAWSSSCLYMSEGVWYLAALLATSFLLALVQMTVEREVDAT